MIIFYNFQERYKRPVTLNLMPVVFLRIFETKFCAGTHSGGQVRYDSDTERIYAALSTFSGTRTGIPCVTRVSCDIGCRQDGKRKSPHLRALTMQMVGLEPTRPCEH